MNAVRRRMNCELIVLLFLAVLGEGLESATACIQQPGW